MGQGGQSRYGELRRQALGLVEQDHGIHQVMKLATGGRAIGKQGFQQLDVRGDDDGSVPVLGQQAALALLGRLGIGLRCLGAQAGQAVVLQDEMRREVGEDGAINLGGLFDDGEIGHRQHDASEPVAAGLLQRELEHGQRLARAGGRGKGEAAGRCLGGLGAGHPEGLAGGAHLGSGLCPRANALAQVAIEGDQAGLGIKHQAWGTGAFAGSVACKMCLGIEKVGIDQAGKEHPHVEHGGDGLSPGGNGLGGGRREVQSVGADASH